MSDSNPRSQVEAACSGAGIATSVPAAVSRVLGGDAVELFGRLSTQDLAPLAKGESVTTIFLSPMGRLLHRVLLQPVEGGLRAVHVSAGEGSFADWVDRYTFAEDCRIEPTEQGASLLVGPRALELAGLPGEGATVERDGLVLSARRFGPLPSVVASGPQPERESWAAGLSERGASPLDGEGLLQLRVEAGVVSAGAEFSEDYHLLEAGLNDDVSFAKGCYTGQEVVARQDSYDKVVRRLAGLVFDGRPEPGAALASENKAACVVTSVAPVAPADLAEGWPSGPACLGFVRSKSFEEGAAVTTESGLQGRMLALPFPALR
jgi:folate-binding protein YgfZ